MAVHTVTYMKFKLFKLGASTVQTDHELILLSCMYLQQEGINFLTAQLPSDHKVCILKMCYLVILRCLMFCIVLHTFYVYQYAYICMHASMYVCQYASAIVSCMLLDVLLPLIYIGIGELTIIINLPVSVASLPTGNSNCDYISSCMELHYWYDV